MREKHSTNPTNISYTTLTTQSLVKNTTSGTISTAGVKKAHAGYDFGGYCHDRQTSLLLQDALSAIRRSHDLYGSLRSHRRPLLLLEQVHEVLRDEEQRAQEQYAQGQQPMGERECALTYEKQVGYGGPVFVFTVSQKSSPRLFLMLNGL